MGLDEVEWDRIVDRLGRAPNHFECSIFAALWSEEVSNKSSASLLETIAREQPEVTTLPGSPLGLIDVGEGTYLALRLTHNNQQAFSEPFYGSQTAIDLALEELSSVGASPLAMLNLLRFGTPDLIKNQQAFRGAVDGLSAYGCRYGLPIIGGELYFHEKYNQGSVINCGVVALLKTNQAFQPPDIPYQSPVLYVGAPTGRDGLRLKNSEEAGNGPVKMTRYIKMSDPLLANRIVNACSEAISRGVLREVITVGAGGLAVACFNLAKRVNKPVLLDIDRVPLRGQGYEPLDIMLSESTERVLMVTTKGGHRALNQVLNKWDLESIKVGEVNDADGIEFYWNHYLAADIPFLFALGGSVQKTMQVVKFPPMLKRSGKANEADRIRKRKRKVDDEWSLVREISLAKEGEDEDREIICPRNLEDVWLDMLANPNLCSRAAMYRLFDQVVGANTLQRPGGDSAVLRLRSFTESVVAKDIRQLAAAAEAAPANGKDQTTTEKAIALTLDSNSLYVSMEPYLGTVQTVAEGMRNLAAAGARPVGLAHCMNFGNPNNYKDICDLSESIRGLGDASGIWGIPIMAEQISLFNGTEGNPIMPTPAILMAGIINDLRLNCSIALKTKGDVILLLGLTENEIGCCEYSHYIHKYVNRLVPDIDFEGEKKICDLIVQMIEEELLSSAHDLSSGGLAVALSECCMTSARPIGAVFQIDPQVFETPNGPVPLRPDAALFGETSGRFLISCHAAAEERVRALCSENGIPITGSGRVGGKMIRVTGAAEVELPISTIYRLWTHKLENLLGRSSQDTQVFL